MIYRWDLDRTYLDTDIGSMRGLWRAATEPAASKGSILGAAELARGLLGARSDARLRFVSGSPVQMRRRLSEKLASDGLRVDRLVLKDNLGNLRKGRLHAVRAQMAYKLGVLVRERAEAPPVVEMLFGDDSEADPAVYALYAALVAGEVGAEGLERALLADGAEKEEIRSVLAAHARWTGGPRVEAAWIRLDRQTPIAAFERLGPVLRPVHAWCQAAPALVDAGHLREADARGVLEVTSSRLGARALAGLMQDAVRRGLATAASTRQLSQGLAGSARAVGAAIEDLPERSAGFGPPFSLDASLAWLRAPDSARVAVARPVG